MALIREDNGTFTAAVYKSPVLPRTRGVTTPEHDRIDPKKGYAITIKLPFKGHIYDYRTGKYFGHTDTFKSFLVPAIANFYSIQKSRVTGVSVKAPAAVTAGSNVSIAFTANGASGAQVFNVNVYDSAGKAQRIYRKNFRAPGNKGTHVFQLPYNAAKGKWQLTVTHVNTGLKKNVNITAK